jgi:DNA-binding transcriptional LysR family regulator
VETGIAAVGAVAGISAGSLSLGSLPTLAADPLAGMVGRFRRRHPGVVVDLSAPEDSPDLIAMVRDGRCEAGITESIGVPDDLTSYEIGVQALLLILPPGSGGWGNPLEDPGVGTRSGVTLPLADLVDVPFIAAPIGTSTRRLLIEGFSADGAEPHIAVVSAQRDAIRRRLPLRHHVPLRLPDLTVDPRSAGPDRARGALALLQPRGDQPGRGKEAPLGAGVVLRLVDDADRGLPAPQDMDLLDRWYRKAGTALHVEGRKPHRPEVAEELLAEMGLDPGIVRAAIDDPTTGDEVQAEHETGGVQGRIRSAHPGLRRRPGPVRPGPGQPSVRGRRGAPVGARDRMARVPPCLRAPAAQERRRTSMPSPPPSPPTSMHATGSASERRHP